MKQQNKNNYEAYSGNWFSHWELLIYGEMVEALESTVHRLFFQRSVVVLLCTCNLKRSWVNYIVTERPMCDVECLMSHEDPSMFNGSRGNALCVMRERSMGHEGMFDGLRENVCESKLQGHHRTVNTHLQEQLLILSVHNHMRRYQQQPLTNHCSALVIITCMCALSLHTKTMPNN